MLMVAVALGVAVDMTVPAATQVRVALQQYYVHVEELVQDCSNSIALAMELLQSCTKPSMW